MKQGTDPKVRHKEGTSRVGCRERHELSRCGRLDGMELGLLAGEERYGMLNRVE